MSRVKTFVATGVAPDGRLYAGDLNAMQDHYADLSNYSQVVGVGTLQVGDATIMLVKYGTGEMRITSALRTDGILRGLGGLFAGTFTTTQRDAIALGSRPYGLIVLNTTTNQFEWNSGTDSVPVWIALSGNLANMPTSNEKAALAGTGSPSGANRYVTNDTLTAAIGGVLGSGSAAGGDLAGTYPNPSVIKASGIFSLTGDISPTVLAGTVNDYNPASLATSSTLRLGASADSAITGIAGGADGRALILHNISAKVITLQTENVGSTAVNRIAGSQNISLAPNESCVLQYDSTSSRWRCVGRNFGTSVTFLQNYLTVDVTMSAANTFFDGPQLVLPPGIWDVAASFTVDPVGGATVGFTAKLWDGSNVVSATETQSSSSPPMTLTLVGIVVVTAQATWKVSVAANASGKKILATPVDNASGLTNKASLLKAVRIG